MIFMLYFKLKRIRIQTVLFKIFSRSYKLNQHNSLVFNNSEVLISSYNFVFKIFMINMAIILCPFWSFISVHNHLLFHFLILSEIYRSLIVCIDFIIKIITKQNMSSIQFWKLAVKYHVDTYSWHYKRSCSFHKLFMVSTH